jgi:hypothetical protein
MGGMQSQSLETQLKYCVLKHSMVYMEAEILDEELRDYSEAKIAQCYETFRKAKEIIEKNKNKTCSTTSTNV